MSCIAVTIDPECGISDDDGQAACQAVDAQAREFATAHGIDYAPIVYFSTDVLTKLDGDDLAKFTADARLLTVQVNLDVPGALGYHDDVLGIIFARVMAGPGWTVTLSHEVLEEMLNPTCGDFTPLEDGREQAREACDRVEGDTYRIGDVLVSNYLLPDAFVPGSAGPWDKLGQLTGWDGMTGGGYMIVRSADGSETDVFADTSHARAKVDRKKARPDVRLSRILAGEFREVLPKTPVVERGRRRRAAA